VRLVAVAAVALTACASAGGGGRDVVPESHDVQVADAGPAPRSQGYDYVAKRPLAIVALAEARGIDPDVARAAIDRVADALDTCAKEQAQRGALTNGAARVVAEIDERGLVAGTNVKIDPGPGVVTTAVACFVAPMKMLVFPPTDGGAAQRGIAVEALWGQLQRQ
jgi:predicted small secreted protein